MIFRSNSFLYLLVRFSKKLHRKWTVKTVIVISIVSFQMTSLKLSILLLRFYFHDVLEHLKTNFHTDLRFKRVLGFVTLAFAREAAPAWRLRANLYKFG